MSSQQNNLFKFSNLHLHLPKSAKLRSAGIYTAGALFSIGFWSLIDALIYSKTVNALDVHVTFVDWIPLICSSLGMLIVNSIEKGNLMNRDSDGFGTTGGRGGGGFGLDDGGNYVWAARIILFLGFSLLAGGVAGSFMVFILKYLMKHYSFPTLGMGVANIVCNGCVMLSCIILWISQNIEDEYSYSLAL
ncbi:vacuolar protein sorting protein 68 [Lodderomyces elongisporus NRRL YB-4239]|uniref:Vacuolar protein sorting protein 68 n=1 Tax=Lodderomyces elongisporus (strain ATCC 11503 / CBS 2605 / JCM 1781 / NBRC 1676 / NRRL YB-4239) TaxID=379508 RepID=A5E591_LODEL|nr:vacuolar protein sorting protein 68 [Lodderomyces elongisporus NRRL YB-4239]